MNVDKEEETVLLSKLFGWYRSDFGKSTNEMVRWVKKRVKDEVRSKYYTFTILLEEHCL